MTGTHVKIGFLALCIALLLGVPVVILSGSRVMQPRGTSIAVEHTTPLSMRLARLASSGTNIFDISLNGSGSFALHLPASWERIEVRGAPIESMTVEPREWGYVRWTMLGGTTARFSTPNPGTITLYNPSMVPVALTTVTVREGVREEDAMIITDDSYVLP